MGVSNRDKAAQHRRLEQRHGAALDNRESVMKIKLHGKYGEGKYALVDATDYPELSKYKWHVNNWGYAVRTEKVNGKVKTILMHRQILNVPDGLVTDHINGDKLDNRRSNLRIATRAQNNYNVDSRNPSISGFKGVNWDKAKNKWVARINKDGKHHHLGYFDDPVFAAKVYDYYATKFFGEFAKLNFPDDVMTHYEKRKLRLTNTSGYIGVSWKKDKRKWHAYIRGKDGKRINIGYFSDKHEAARAYNEKALELYGESAQLNEIMTDKEVDADGSSQAR